MKFVVKLEHTTYSEHLVEANNEEEAIEKAYENDVEKSIEGEFFLPSDWDASAMPLEEHPKQHLWS